MYTIYIRYRNFDKLKFEFGFITNAAISLSTCISSRYIYLIHTTIVATKKEKFHFETSLISAAFRCWFRSLLENIKISINKHKQMVFYRIFFVSDTY